MDGLRYSLADPYYRLWPVHTCLNVPLFITFTSAETGELTEEFFSEGDLQGLPGCSNPRILGKPTINFEFKLYSQNCRFHRAPETIMIILNKEYSSMANLMGMRGSIV